jgi:hypothetical protein
MVESNGCKYLRNKHTKATGCLQVHPIHTPDRLALEMLKNPRHGIPEGVRLLASFKHPCQFNLGRRGMKNNPDACVRYKTKLKKYGWRR